ncbi:MAG: PEP-CTERM sorting domain-containing protein [Planctomycetes bacterium]|nr:PEP-CTERM sorting domain-containing protein [Planctomycetota bacterium]
MAYILALLLLSITTILAASLAAGTNLTLAAGANQRGVFNAQMAAESGMAFAESHMSNISIASGATNTLEAIRDELISRLNGTGNLAGQGVVITDNVVTVPSISLGADLGSFAVEIAEVDASRLRMTVTGTAPGGTVSYSRKLTLDFNLQAASSTTVFDHAVVSKSTFQMDGQAKICGTNDPSEADVLSLSGETTSFDLKGKASIAGDVYVTVDPSQVSVSNNSTIAGCRANDPDLTSHIHSIDEELTIPEVDTSVFEPFATTDVTAGTSTSGTKTFTNIRVKAGTNKNFSGQITLNGVIFIEAPNQVHFSGQVTINGVIVTEDAGENAYDENTITFSGQANANGVEALPDLPDEDPNSAAFTQLKQMPGSFLLAPGFGVSCSGQFATINGTMAADKFTFSGQAGGTVQGSIISYGPEPVTLSGQSTFCFDHSSTLALPAGFVPEPATLSLLALGGLALICRKQK